MSQRLQGSVCIAVLLAAACSSNPPAAPALLSCDATNTRSLTLAVGDYASVTQPCVTVAANASSTDSTEYLVVAQSVAASAGTHAAFQLQGAGFAGAAGVAQWQPALPEFRGSVAVQFDNFFRQRGRSLAAPATRAAATAASLAGAVRAAVVPPVVGENRTFTVCANLTCTSVASVTAPAAAVTAHVAVYADPAAPGGLNSSYLDSLSQLFEQHVYEVDTTAFGRESDIDSNGIVAVLMTGVVNALVTSAQCHSSGYVAGFFNPGDLYPNNTAPHTPGEVMYTIVPDPGGTLSCPHDAASVRRVVPPTLLHELQHMINFNQHFFVQQGAPEEVWLDEALSKYAEELGGRTFLAGNPPDSASFLSYAGGDLNDAYIYLAAPGDHYLVTPTDQNLGDVGAGWLLMRYAVDQFGASLPRKLVVGTKSTGVANLTLQTGVLFPTLAARWALANWVSDLPGFTAPLELQYTSWRLRDIYASLHASNPTTYPQPFPLVPTVGGVSQVNLSGVLKAGSGVYVRCVQPPRGGSVTLLFGAPGPTALPSVMAAQFEVIRVR